MHGTCKYNQHPQHIACNPPNSLTIAITWSRMWKFLRSAKKLHSEMAIHWNFRGTIPKRTVFHHLHEWYIWFRFDFSSAVYHANSTLFPVAKWIEWRRMWLLSFGKVFHVYVWHETGAIYTLYARKLFFSKLPSILSIVFSHVAWDNMET